MKLVIIGGGKMGYALIGGLIATQWASAGELGVVEPVLESRVRLDNDFPGLVVAHDIGELQVNDVVLAVKPNDCQAACHSAAAAGAGRIISIAAGITTARLESWAIDAQPAAAASPGAGNPVVIRVMPNTPALVGKAMSGIAAGRFATPDDIQWAESILGAVGDVAVVPEDLMDAITGVSGSGPAYFFLVVEALAAAAVEVGVDPAMADALARRTFIGAAHLLEETGDTPENLRHGVTSPGGTTAAGIAELQESGLAAMFSACVRAATNRSIELGKES